MNSAGHVSHHRTSHPRRVVSAFYTILCWLIYVMLLFTVILTVHKYPSKIVFAFFDFHSGKIFFSIFTVVYCLWSHRRLKCALYWGLWHVDLWCKEHMLLSVFEFYVLLHVHTCVILHISPTTCTILLNIFISLLYMFRASMCSSSGENCCIYATLVFVNLYGWCVAC